MVERRGEAFVFLPFVHRAAFLKGKGRQCRRSWLPVMLDYSQLQAPVRTAENTIGSLGLHRPDG